ncbi:hypothetical protein NDU88_010878 [Pleurodeles waltl]|uniref:Uncharacterized protein n=1 Tax=Pleurodeles waltl TaxID=8319 RepID=A0AAV7S0W6_PLEWA|nr:hypothetical protein NDU88_010878 [Pleurodeles waltl]
MVAVVACASPDHKWPDLYDVPFGDGGVGDGEVPSTSAECCRSGVLEERDLDFDVDKCEEGEIVDDQEWECWGAPHDMQKGQESTNGERRLGVFQNATESMGKLVDSIAELRHALCWTALVRALTLRPNKKGMDGGVEIGVQTPVRDTQAFAEQDIRLQKGTPCPRSWLRQRAEQAPSALHSAKTSTAVRDAHLLSGKQGLCVPEGG